MLPTYGINKHGQPAQGCDGVREVRLGKVQLADVAADLLHHHLAGLRLAPNLPDLAEQLLDGRLGCCEVLPVKRCYNLPSNMAHRSALLCMLPTGQLLSCWPGGVILEAHDILGLDFY